MAKRKVSVRKPRKAKASKTPKRRAAPRKKKAPPAGRAQPPLNITINSSGGNSAGGNSAGGTLGGSSFESTAGHQYLDGKTNELFAKIHEVQSSLDKHLKPTMQLPPAFTPPPLMTNPLNPPTKKKPMNTFSTNQSGKVDIPMDMPAKPILSTSQAGKINVASSPGPTLSTSKLNSINVPSSFERKKAPTLSTHVVGASNNIPTTNEFQGPPPPTSQELVPVAPFLPRSTQTLPEMEQALVRYEAPSSRVRQPIKTRPVADRVDGYITDSTALRKELVADKRKKGLVKMRVEEVEEAVIKSQRAVVQQRLKQKRQQADIEFRLQNGLPIEPPPPKLGDKRLASLV